MADRLTQLQDSLDELLMQMSAALSYIHTHHPYGEISGQPSQAPQAVDDAERKNSVTTRIVPVTMNGNTDQNAADDGQGTIKAETTTPLPDAPDAPDAFRSALRELAQDLVMQEQKTEILINSLPGIGNSERDQRRKMEELEMELRQVEADRLRVEEEKITMLKGLDQVITGLGRVQ